jgi:hypothetical protein
MDCTKKEFPWPKLVASGVVSKHKVLTSMVVTKITRIKGFRLSGVSATLLASAFRRH